MILPLMFTLACFAGDGSSAPAPQLPPVPPAGEPTDEQVHKQMEDLIQTVELNLHKIDRSLYAAAAGQKFQGPVIDSGMGSLLQQAEADGQGVQRDIAKVLELAASHVHHPPSGSGGT